MNRIHHGQPIYRPGLHPVPPPRLSPPFVTVLVGGTSGIGEATIKTLARHAASPGARFYIVGRNESAAAAIVAECERLGPGSEDVEFVFIRQDVSLLKNVDMVCAQIAAREDHVDLLFMTQGYLNLGGRNGERSDVPTPPGGFLTSF